MIYALCKSLQTGIVFFTTFYKQVPALSFVVTLQHMQQADGALATAVLPDLYGVFWLPAVLDNYHEPCC